MRSCAAFAHLVFSNGSSGKRKVKSIGHLRPPTISPEPPEDSDHLGPVGRAENSLAFVHKHGKHLVQYVEVLRRSSGAWKGRQPSLPLWIVVSTGTNGGRGYKESGLN